MEISRDQHFLKVVLKEGEQLDSKLVEVEDSDYLSIHYQSALEIPDFLKDFDFLQCIHFYGNAPIRLSKIINEIETLSKLSFIGDMRLELPADFGTNSIVRWIEIDRKSSAETLNDFSVFSIIM